MDEQSLPVLYFDEACRPMEARTWQTLYPARLRVAVSKLPDLNVVCTEFVGINHNTGRGRPWIYQTWAVNKDRRLLVDGWTSRRWRARLLHLWTVIRVLWVTRRLGT